MFEGKPQKKEIIIPKNAEDFFSRTSMTHENRFAKKIIERHIKKNKVDIEFINTSENIEILRGYISSQKMFKDYTEGIIEELLKSGLFKEQETVKERKVDEKRKEVIITNRPEQINLNEVDLSQEEKNKIESNIGIPGRKNENLLNNKEKLQSVYEQIEYDKTASWSHYQEFVDAGIIDIETAKRDFDDIQEKKKQHKKNSDERVIRSKKIATIVERGAELAISDLQWLGNMIKLKKAAEFNDIKRGIDNYLIIKKEDEGSDFIGLATDVTFRRIEEVDFDDKFFGILKSIIRGYKTKVKYEKDLKEMVKIYHFLLFH